MVSQTTLGVPAVVFCSRELRLWGRRNGTAHTTTTEAPSTVPSKAQRFRLTVLAETPVHTLIDALEEVVDVGALQYVWNTTVEHVFSSQCPAWLPPQSL